MRKDVIPTPIQPANPAMFDKIPDTIQSTRYLARKLATKFRFLALAAALAFLSLNLSASPLHDAVKNGNLYEVNRLIAARADVSMLRITMDEQHCITSLLLLLQHRKKLL